MTTLHVIARLCLLVMLALALPGCELVEGIFKLGMWTAFILVGLLALAAVALFRHFRAARH